MFVLSKELTEIVEEMPHIHRIAAQYQLNPSEEARQVLLKNNGKDYTTIVDCLVEECLRNELGKRWTGVDFLGEELSKSGYNARYCWIVDPTDGTAVFVTNGEYYSQSIALADCEKKTIVFSSVYQPATQRNFVQAVGEGYWVTEHVLLRTGFETRERIPVPSLTQGAPELMVCAYGTSEHYDKIPGIKQRLDNVFVKQEYQELKDGKGKPRAYSIINARPASGSCALYCSDIADGKRHAALLFFQAGWDLAGGAIIAKRAGCVVKCGTSISNWDCGDLEAQVAQCDKTTKINVRIFANTNVESIIMEKFNLQSSETL